MTKKEKGRHRCNGATLIMTFEQYLINCYFSCATWHSLFSECLVVLIGGAL